MIGDSGLLAWDVSSCSTLPHYQRYMETTAGDADVVLHERATRRRETSSVPQVLTTALLPTPQNHRSSWLIWSRYCARQPDQHYQVLKRNQGLTLLLYCDGAGGGASVAKG